MSADYRSTVFLPGTELPMKARLPQREPEILARWKRLDIYRRMGQTRCLGYALSLIMGRAGEFLRYNISVQYGRL